MSYIRILLSIYTDGFVVLFHKASFTLNWKFQEGWNISVRLFCVRVTNNKYWEWVTSPFFCQYIQMALLCYSIMRHSLLNWNFQEGWNISVLLLCRNYKRRLRENKISFIVYFSSKKWVEMKMNSIIIFEIWHLSREEYIDSYKLNNWFAYLTETVFIYFLWNMI
jgi:hypothetical protein